MEPALVDDGLAPLDHQPAHEAQAAVGDEEGRMALDEPVEARGEPRALDDLVVEVGEPREGRLRVVEQRVEDGPGEVDVEHAPRAPRVAVPAVVQVLLEVRRPRA